MTNFMHFMHPPKSYKFDEVVTIFLSGKNRPLHFAKGVHWCLIFTCSLHLMPGTWDTSQRKFMIFHQLSQKLIYLDWLDFYVYVHTNVCWSFFSFWKYIFLLGKNTKLGTSPTHRNVMNCQLYQYVIVTDWSMKCDFFICRMPSCFKLWAYWFIHCIDDRPTLVYSLDCVKLLQYSCIFHCILLRKCHINFIYIIFVIRTLHDCPSKMNEDLLISNSKLTSDCQLIWWR